MRLTINHQPAQTSRTTTSNGNTAPRKLCGFFMPDLQAAHRILLNKCGWLIPGTKGQVCLLSNNRNRFDAVVEAIRTPSTIPSEVVQISVMRFAL